ncbi:MAG: hypothetical protein LEGION0398_MBIBDBAK_01402 [Legionellaceae bacterium]
MNAKQRKTLFAIFEKPTLSNIGWSDIEKLMIALRAKIKEGKGSAGVFVLNKKVFPFHRPHPQKEAKRYQVDELRKFLSNMGIVP